MRKIGIRQFQQNFHKELKKLPFIVTKDGQDYCVVTPLTAINDIAKVLRSDNVTTPVTTYTREDLKRDFEVPAPRLMGESEPEEIADARKQGRCSPQNDSCKNLGYLYEVTYPTDEGERKVKRFLCDFHVKKTRDSGQEVSEV